MNRALFQQLLAKLASEESKYLQKKSASDVIYEKDEEALKV